MCEIPGDVIFFSEVQLIISSCASVITYRRGKRDRVEE